MGIYEMKSFAEEVEGNSYVGRGIVIGMTRDRKKAVTAYFIMGRSENSRNRVFEKTEDGIIIHAFDPSKLSDPSLVIYSPVRSIGNRKIVTNGDQTDTIWEFLKNKDYDRAFEDALETREFEPDAPNFTPRISGILTFDKEQSFDYKLSILKSADANGTACNRYTYSYKPLAGLGHFIHTYLQDGNPIPTFCGEPARIIVPDAIDEFTEEIWNSLDKNNKVSLYVSYTDLEDGSEATRIINRNR